MFMICVKQTAKYSWTVCVYLWIIKYIFVLLLLERPLSKAHADFLSFSPLNLDVLEHRISVPPWAKHYLLRSKKSFFIFLFIIRGLNCKCKTNWSTFGFFARFFDNHRSKSSGTQNTVYCISRTLVRNYMTFQCKTFLLTVPAMN